MLSLPERPTRALVRSIHRHPYLYLAVALGLSVLMLHFGRSLKLKSKVQDLLPEHAPSVQAMEVLQQRLGSADILVVTLMTDDFEKVKGAMPDLVAALEAHEDIAHVDWRQDVAMIDRNALIIFPTLAELEDYHTELSAEIQAAVKKGLRLFDDDGPAEAAEKPPETGPKTWAWGEFEADDGLGRLGRTFRAERGKYPEFFHNRSYTTIGLKVFPTKPSSNLDFCKHILGVVDGIVRAEAEKRFGAVGEDGVVKRIDLGGGYRNAIEESDQIKGDMVSSAGIAFAVLALIVIGFFRSIRALFCVMLPLIMANCWTIGLVALTVGYLNLITAFIFAVLLGLGIDFGIHFYGRWREERAAGKDDLEAMVMTHVHCGEASLLGAVTTAAAFLALTLADFRGFSQFGGVAAAGVMLCLLAVFVVFPALVFIFERWMPLRLMGYSVDRDASGAIDRTRFPLGRGVVVGGVTLVLGGLLLAPRVGFEYDFRKLGPKDEEKKEHESLQYGTVESTAPAVIFTDSQEDARHIYAQLDERVAAVKAHPRIKSYQALFALVPEQQAEKKAWVEKICRKLGRKVKLFEGDARDGADELLRHCDPVEFGPEDLPDWVKAKFSDKDGRLGEFIFVAPRGSTSDGEVALAFREEMLSLKGLDGEPPVVSGKPMVWAEVIIAMKHDGLLTTAASMIVVVLLLFLFLRSPAGVAMVLVPLFVAIGVGAGAMALFGWKLNFFNMLAAPTVIGMGVDAGVHMYHRRQELGRHSGRYIFRTTGMSAALSTLTTMVGFGSLMTANHLGLNSLGLLTNVGMGAALLGTLIILPALMRWLDERADRREEANAN